MIYITGDTHRDFSHIELFCETYDTSKDDIMIVLGDACINYFGAMRDDLTKRYLTYLPITFFCIHGNHEIRPYNVSGYQPETFCGGLAYVDPRYPNQVFAIDGQKYTFDGKQCLVIGGAYSIDKPRRTPNRDWWPDEQPDDTVKKYVGQVLDASSWRVDVVLSHTCPLRYEPREAFLSNIDQKTVDKTTEKWLGEIESMLDYDKWYCGHYHINKTIDRVRFLANDIIEFA